MDDFITAVQSGPWNQSQVFGSTVQDLKCIVPSFLDEANDLVGEKKLQSVERDWICVKELLECIVDTEEGTFALPDIKHKNIFELFNLMALQHPMVRKYLEQIIGELHYIHLVVPVAVACLYNLQHTLTQGDENRALILTEFHQDLGDWNVLVKQAEDLPIDLADIVQAKPTHLGFLNTSIIGAVCIWIEPDVKRTIIMGCHPWLEGLVSEINLRSTTTNSDLDLTIHVLHKVTLLSSTTKAVMVSPHLDSENTPPVSFSTR